MLVFTQNNKDKLLMPCKPSKARKLLKEGKANVIRRTPPPRKGSPAYEDE